MQLFLLTVFSLFAFAGNSIICRIALGEQHIDAAHFTVIRLMSGAFTLLFINMCLNGSSQVLSRGNWFSALSLFVYAVSFSFAYTTLTTADGALVLFTVVQLAMFAFSYFSNGHITKRQWLGAMIAMIGFIYLIAPELQTPSATGFILMSMSGLAWAAYTINGQKSNNPLADTTFNFIRTLPFALILLLIYYQPASVTKQGALLAVISGAITSGIGYAIWYRALRELKTIHAAIVQLMVPIFAAVGGIIWLAEPLGVRLVISASIILWGIWLVVFCKAMRQP